MDKTEKPSPLPLWQRLRAAIHETIIGADETVAVKAISIGVGVFFGIAPFWGLQMLLALAVAWLLRLNKAITLISSNISLPPMIPFILFGSYEVGKLFVGDIFEGSNYQQHSYLVAIHDWLASVIKNFNIKDTELAGNIISHIAQYVVGSFALATVAGLFAGIVAYVILKVVKK